MVLLSTKESTENSMFLRGKQHVLKFIHICIYIKLQTYEESDTQLHTILDLNTLKKRKRKRKKIQ